MGAIFSGAGIIELGGAWANMKNQNQALANERNMLEQFESTHDNPDMTRQWELYQYMQNGTLKSDGDFASQATNQYLHGLGGAR